VLQREAAFTAVDNGRAKPLVTKCADICLSGDPLAYLGGHLLSWLSLCPSTARRIADDGITFALLCTFPLLDVRSPLATSIISVLLASTAAETPATLHPLVTDKGARILTKALVAIQEPLDDAIPGHVLAETRAAILSLLIRAATSSSKGRVTIQSAAVSHEGLLSHSNYGGGSDNAMTQAANVLAAQLEMLLRPKALPISRAPHSLQTSDLNTDHPPREAKGPTNTILDTIATASDVKERHAVPVTVDVNPHASSTELRGADTQKSHAPLDRQFYVDYESGMYEHLNVDGFRPSELSLSSRSKESNPRAETSEVKATVKLYAEPKETTQFETNDFQPRTGEDSRDQAPILFGLAESTSAPPEPKPLPLQAIRKVSKKAAKSSSK
jgi:hypothetical protein